MNTVSTQKRKYELKARAEAQEADPAADRRRGRRAARGGRRGQHHRRRHRPPGRGAARHRLQPLRRPRGAAARLQRALARAPSAARPRPRPSRSRTRANGCARCWKPSTPGTARTSGMQLRVQGERSTVPELERWMASTADVTQDALAAGLADGFGRKGAAAERTRTLIRLALDFWTWRRLSTEGLDDARGGGADERAAALARSSHLPPSRAVFGGSSIKLARVFGIRIGVDVSWFFVFFLVIYWLTGEFQEGARYSDGTSLRSRRAQRHPALPVDRAARAGPRPGRSAAGHRHRQHRPVAVRRPGQDGARHAHRGRGVQGRRRRPGGDARHRGWSASGSPR